MVESIGAWERVIYFQVRFVFSGHDLHSVSVDLTSLSLEQTIDHQTLEAKIE